MFTFTPQQARTYLVTCCWWSKSAAAELTDDDATRTALREYTLRLVGNGA